jgi:hypothetical protein
VVRIPTLQILVAQGVSDSFPWSAHSFAPVWLQLIGFSHDDTAVLMAIFWFARWPRFGKTGRRTTRFAVPGLREDSFWRTW